jgi:hypothetical protein
MEDNTLVKSSFAITINVPVDADVGADRYQKTLTLSHKVPHRHAMDRVRQTSKE